MPGEEIKKKITSVLKNASSATKPKDPKLKKSIFSIFSKQAGEEQLKKISPLFQTTSCNNSIAQRKSLKLQFSKEMFYNLTRILRSKAQTVAKLLVKGLGVTEDIASVWGLDIGTDCIKLLKISHEEERPHLTHLYCQSISPKLRNPGTARNTYIKQILKKMVVQLRAEGELAIFSISSSALIARTIKLPQMDGDELVKAVEWRLSQQHGVDLKSQIMQYVVLGEKEDRGVKQIEVLTVTCPKEIIAEHLSLLQHSGLKPLAIEPDCFSLTASFLENYAWKPEEIIALLNIGARYSTFNIVNNGKLCFSRKISFGSRDFFLALINQFNYSLEEAEKELETFGIPKIDWQYVTSQAETASQTEELRVFKAIQAVLEKLITEFRSTFDFYSYQMTHSAVQRMDRVFISGGASRIKNLSEFLNVRLETPVEQFNPLKKIQVAKEVDSQLVERFAAHLDVAVGAALRRTI